MADFSENKSIPSGFIKIKDTSQLDDHISAAQGGPSVPKKAKRHTIIWLVHYLVSGLVGGLAGWVNACMDGETDRDRQTDTCKQTELERAIDR
jgi:hypothetical protein